MPKHICQRLFKILRNIAIDMYKACQLYEQRKLPYVRYNQYLLQDEKKIKLITSPPKKNNTQLNL